MLSITAAAFGYGVVIEDYAVDDDIFLVPISIFIKPPELLLCDVYCYYYYVLDEAVVVYYFSRSGVDLSCDSSRAPLLKNPPRPLKLGSFSADEGVLLVGSATAVEML